MQLAGTPQTPEVWRNVGRSTVFVWKINHLGVMVDQVVRPKQTVSLSASDREYNQSMCARPEYDMFTNGSFEAVQAETAEDVQALNDAIVDPTHDDDGLDELLGLHWKTFNKRIGEMNNLTNLERLWEIINDPERDVSASKLNTVSDRIEVLTGNAPERPDAEGED